MIKVLNPGFFSTIQDLGRRGYTQYGVPISGAMDQRAANLANALVGNREEAAVLEITMSGPKLKFETATTIAITGANISATLNGNPIANNHVVGVKKDDILSFGRLKTRFRAYLAVSGGFQTNKVLQSRSMYQGLTETNRLLKNDTLKIKMQTSSFPSHFSGIKVNDAYLDSAILEVFKGPEFDTIPDAVIQQLFNTSFSISKDNSRMAYQLNETIDNNLKTIITSPVLPGTVQLTPAGKLIVLMRDCQTTGGYPRVLQLTNSAITILSQKFTGNVLRFVLKD